MPRIGKFHLGIKVTKNKKGEDCKPYPKAVDYFVYPEADAEGSELVEQLTKAFGEKPKELRIIFPLEDEESIASQYYRCYTRSRGLVCRGDGETSMRVLDAKTGHLPTQETSETALKEMSCEGMDCPEYKSGQCREVMNLQFMLPEISGMGVWQIDTSSINSIKNINSCLEMIKAIYGRVAMVPMLLTLEKMAVTPPGGTKKNVYVLNIRSTDTMIEAAIKAQKPPLELVSGPPDFAQAEEDIKTLWPQSEQDRKLSESEAAERMTPEEIEKAEAEEIASLVLVCAGGCGKTTEGMTKETKVGEFKADDIAQVPEWTCPECVAKREPEEAAPGKEEQTTALVSQPEPEQVEEMFGLVHGEWLRETLKIFEEKKTKAGSEKNILSFMKVNYKVEAKTVFEGAAKLKEGEAAHFTKMLQDMRDMV